MAFKIVSATKDIAAAATPEAISATAILTSKVWIQCPAANTSDLLIGDATTRVYVVPKGTSIEIGNIDNERGTEEINLADIWVKAGTNGDDVNFLYVTKV